MDIQDLACRVLVYLDQSIEAGKNSLEVQEIVGGTDISDRHVYRLLNILSSERLIKRDRLHRPRVYELTPKGQEEVKRLREYFRLS